MAGAGPKNRLRLQPKRASPGGSVNPVRICIKREEYGKMTYRYREYLFIYIEDYICWHQQIRHTGWHTSRYRYLPYCRYGGTELPALFMFRSSCFFDIPQLNCGSG